MAQGIQSLFVLGNLVNLTNSIYLVRFYLPHKDQQDQERQRILPRGDLERILCLKFILTLNVPLHSLDTIYVNEFKV